jgi:hypothetical protein
MIPEAGAGCGAVDRCAAHTPYCWLLSCYHAHCSSLKGVSKSNYVSKSIHGRRPRPIVFFQRQICIHTYKLCFRWMSRCRWYPEVEFSRCWWVVITPYRGILKGQGHSLSPEPIEMYRHLCIFYIELFYMDSSKDGNLNSYMWKSVCTCQRTTRGASTGSHLYRGSWRPWMLQFWVRVVDGWANVVWFHLWSSASSWC